MNERYLLVLVRGIG